MRKRTVGSTWSEDFEKIGTMLRLFASKASITSSVCRDLIFELMRKKSNRVLRMQFWSEDFEKIGTTGFEPATPTTPR